jgi:hypothetical protein
LKYTPVTYKTCFLVLARIYCLYIHFLSIQTTRLFVRNSHLLPGWPDLLKNKESFWNLKIFLIFSDFCRVFWYFPNSKQFQLAALLMNWNLINFLFWSISIVLSYFVWHEWIRNYLMKEINEIEDDSHRSTD